VYPPLVPVGAGLVSQPRYATAISGLSALMAVPVVAVPLVPELVDLASTGEAPVPVTSSTVMDTEDAMGRAADRVVAPPSEVAAAHTSSSVCLPRTTAVTRVKLSPALSETDPGRGSPWAPQ